MPAPKPSSNASTLSADLAARAPLVLQKLYRICRAEVRRLKARYSLATVNLALSRYRSAIRAIEPDHLVLRLRKMRSDQRFSYLALKPEEARALNAAYHQRIHLSSRDELRLELRMSVFKGFPPKLLRFFPYS